MRYIFITLLLASTAYAETERIEVYGSRETYSGIRVPDYMPKEVIEVDRYRDEVRVYDTNSLGGRELTPKETYRFDRDLTDAETTSPQPNPYQWQPRQDR